jgi:ATP-dependent DNA ligase
MLGQFQTLPLHKRLLPFDNPDWMFELKYDGFRASPKSNVGAAA